MGGVARMVRFSALFAVSRSAGKSSAYGLSNLMSHLAAEQFNPPWQSQCHPTRFSVMREAELVEARLLRRLRPNVSSCLHLQVRLIPQCLAQNQSFSFARAPSRRNSMSTHFSVGYLIPSLASLLSLLSLLAPRHPGPRLSGTPNRPMTSALKVAPTASHSRSTLPALS